VEAFINGQGLPEDVAKGYSTAAWIASSLADSPEAIHKKKAFLFASLSKKVFPADSRVDTLCFAIFARTGNIPATRHLSFLLKDRDTDIHLLGALEIEFLSAYSQSISLFSEELTLTEFQARVEKALVEDLSGLFTAPTSAGKSFIVHEYVKYKLNKNEDFFCIFIVPTKALIAQFSSIYRSFRLENDLAFGVYTSIPDGLQLESNQAVFCLTQERCIKILSSNIRDKISFVFVDEIQKVEDKGRGALLEYVINELQRYAPSSQMFFAGPYISNAQSLARSLSLNVEKPIATADSPVSQMVIKVKPVLREKMLELTLLQSNQDDNLTFLYEVDKKYHSRWATQGTAIADAIDVFASDSPSIAYAKGSGTARNWAVTYADRQDNIVEPTRDLAELIEYIEESIHPKCSLVYCLERGVAFHHGKLPDFVREEIEELFSSRVVDIIFCTSTLLEGVNLPADKIFVLKPSKGDEGLSLFEFRNLIGRAGRLKDHLNGIVYCIHTPGNEDDDWVNEYEKFEDSPIETFIDNSLRTHAPEIKAAINSDSVIMTSEDTNDLRNTLTILRSRFLVDENSAIDYLKRKSILDEDRDEIVHSLKRAVQKLSIPPELAEKSPYVDPILQDDLYRKVLEDKESWRIRRRRGFSEDFANVFERLDDVFDLVDECRPYATDEWWASLIVSYAKDWLNGVSFSGIVRRALPRRIRQSPDISYKEVDKAVERAQAIITTDVSFVTAKYFSVLSEILKFVLDEGDIERYSFTIGLPVMLELGSRDPKQLSLITACIPRGAALKLSQYIPDVDDPVEWLTVNQGRVELQKIPRLYQRILRRVGIWQ
jgi:superfamily II DNA/RNA helicase